jgi:hypothetical protein
MATTVYSSGRSSVQIDGETVDGLQSLAFRVVTEQEDVRAVGTNERVAVVFGLRTVQGELAVKSANLTLDGHLKDQAKFQLVANLRQDDKVKRTLSFDECYVRDKDFSLGAGGSVITTYGFTATRLREE